MVIHMKTMTCAQMGGMCETAISGATKDEMLANGMKHLDEAHPEMAQAVRSASPDDPEMVKWQEKFDADFAALPEE